MTSTRFSSRTAAGTLAGLMGASLLLPALATRAASLEFDCYSRSTQELLVKAAYDMSNEGMACLKSSTTPEAAGTEVTDAATGSTPEAPAGETAEASAPAETDRPPGLGAVIVGGIVNSLMDKLLNRLMPGSAEAVDAGADAGAVDAAALDQSAMDAGAAEVQPQAQPQAQNTGSRPWPKFAPLMGKSSIIPGLIQQAPQPGVRKPAATAGSSKISKQGSTALSTTFPSFSGLNRLR